LRWTQFKSFSAVLPANGLLQYDSQDTCDYTEQRNTFNEGRSQDHVRTDVTSSFWLTGDAFNSTLTDLSDTYAGAEGSQTSTECATSLSETRSFQQNCVQQRHVTMDLSEKKKRD
jgi:hypothetical protein